jgi:DNA primase
MPHLTEKSVTAIRDAAKIATYTGEGWIAHRQGFMTDCPLCDTEASLIVNDRLNLFFCFGCGRKGDIFDLVQGLGEPDLGFEGAVERVANNHDLDHLVEWEYSAEEKAVAAERLREALRPRRQSYP